ncbi:hypothetical protein [Lacinutrix chionoecetis]
MEHRFIRKSILLLLSLLFSCFQNDKIDYEVKIVDNITLSKQENSNNVNLMFKEEGDIYAVIVSNCSEVYFDSSNMVIYVKEEINSFNYNFHKIEIVNKNAKYIFKSVEKSILTENNYHEYTKNLNTIYLSQN